jgi:hypothetical protein
MQEPEKVPTFQFLQGAHLSVFAARTRRYPPFSFCSKNQNVPTFQFLQARKNHKVPTFQFLQQKPEGTHLSVSAWMQETEGTHLSVSAIQFLQGCKNQKVQCTHLSVFACKNQMVIIDGQTKILSYVCSFITEVLRGTKYSFITTVVLLSTSSTSYEVPYFDAFQEHVRPVVVATTLSSLSSLLSLHDMDGVSITRLF